MYSREVRDQEGVPVHSSSSLGRNEKILRFPAKGTGLESRPRAEGWAQGEEPGVALCSGKNGACRHAHDFDQRYAAWVECVGLVSIGARAENIGKQTDFNCN